MPMSAGIIWAANENKLCCLDVSTLEQIEAGMQADPFYLKHGTNAMLYNGLSRRISRSAVKEYIKRLRLALELASRQAGLNLDPRQVIASELTVMNQVGYRLKATVEWSHFYPRQEDTLKRNFLATYHVARS